MSSWNNVTSDGRNDLVFADRNKSYGAFVIRKDYNRVILVAFLIAVASMTFASFLPKIIELLTPKEVAPVEVVTTIELADLNEPEEKKKEEPPPPEDLPPPPPPEETVKFVPPEIKDDAKEEETPPDLTKDDTKIADTTKAGTDDPPDFKEPEKTGPVKVEEPPTLLVVTNMPEFPGGDLNGWIGKHINYPQIEKEASIQGKVWVEFVVMEDGRVDNVVVKKGVKGGPGLDAEAARVIKSLPKWKPGENNGHAARVKYTVPINFVIQ